MTTERIDIAEVEIEGRKELVFLGKDEPGGCALVAIANVLSVEGKLNMAHNSKERPLTMKELHTLVATQLRMNATAEGKQSRVDDCILLLPQLGTQMALNVNFRRIRDFNAFPENDIFGLLGVPLFHAWKVLPRQVEIIQQGDFQGDELQTALAISLAEATPILPEEKRRIDKNYPRTPFTSHGYAELLQTIPGPSVFYWNGLFYTIRKIDNDICILTVGDKEQSVVCWKKLNESSPVSRVGDPMVSIATVALSADDHYHFDQALKSSKWMDNIPLAEPWLRLVQESSMDQVIKSLKDGHPYDVIVMNYRFAMAENTRDKKWVEKLHSEGFSGELVALVWFLDLPSNEFSDLVLQNLYMWEDPNLGGVTLVRAECMEDQGDPEGLFAGVFGGIVNDAIWNRGL